MGKRAEVIALGEAAAGLDLVAAVAAAADPEGPAAAGQSDPRTTHV